MKTISKNNVCFYIELLLVAFFTWQLIASIISDVQFNHTYYDFNISDWLINYQGGFIRRGLIGEVLYQIYQLHPFSIKTAIISIDICAFLAFAALSVRAFIRERWSLLPLLFPLACVDSGIIKDQYFLTFPILAQYLLGVLISAALLFPMAYVMNKLK